MKVLIAVFCALVLLCSCSVQPAPVPTQAPTDPPPTLPQSPYRPEDFRYDGDHLICDAGQTVMGIDVSAHQQDIDWQQVAASGVEFAIIRLGYRGTREGQLYTDTFARINLEGARNAGLRVGAYFFSQAISVAEAKEEAEMALEILDGFSLDLPLVYDWVYVNENARTANSDARTVTDCTLTFCTAVEKAGYESMVYFNSYQAAELLYLGELQAYPWWLDMYDTAAAFPCRADLWQYTNKGSIPGVAGDVDINLMFTDFGLGKEVWAETE